MDEVLEIHRIAKENLESGKVESNMEYADQIYSSQRVNVDKKVKKISDYFASKRFNVNTVDPSFNQMLEIIDAEKKVDEKKKLIDEAARLKFKIAVRENQEEAAYDPLNIYLDDNLTDKEKEIKKMKKLIGNQKAFYQYKKRGSLMRDKDYLKIQNRIKQRQMLETIKKNLSQGRRRHLVSSLIEEDKKVIHSHQSMNLQFDKDNIGLFTDLRSIDREKKSKAEKTPKVRNVSTSLYPRPARTSKLKVTNSLVKIKDESNGIRAVSSSGVKTISPALSTNTSRKNYEGNYISFDSHLSRKKTVCDSIAERIPRKKIKQINMPTFGQRKKTHNHTMRNYQKSSMANAPGINSFAKHRNSINVASDLKPEHIKFKRPTFQGRREKKWVAKEKFVHDSSNFDSIFTKQRSPNNLSPKKVRFSSQEEPNSELKPLVRKSPLVLRKQKSIKKSKKCVKQVKTKIKDLIDKCRFAEENDEYNQCQKYDCDIYLEDLKHQELSATLEIMQNIEFAEAGTLYKLFEHQYKNKQQELNRAIEVNKEYRSGIMDPSRDVAQHERQAAIKKKIIAQKSSLG
ncbi:unnamed protein product [Moneuplotes crassus]|uniref:Uncharacterized protein n=1 Tax=Euplotes crassus TaxID=5936 RepID=A0AAD1U3A4_EUPCR|nr:unnamed protein product [Moneuplotes crassus]